MVARRQGIGWLLVSPRIAALTPIAG